MSDLAKNLAAAWKDRADREAALPTFAAPALFEPERARADFETAVHWYRYWTGLGGA